MHVPEVEFVRTISLKHAGDCYLLGIGDHGSIFVEEVYSEDGWLCQSVYQDDGKCLSQQDEDFGRNTLTSPLEGLAELPSRQRGWFGMALNFAGPRHRGLREPERLMDVIRPISVSDRLKAAELLHLSAPPVNLLGLAESYVIAETRLSPSLFFVCRRLRLAYALPEVQHDEDGLPYDYDTLLVYAGHFFEPNTERDYSLVESLHDYALQPRPQRPMDCIHHNGHLYVADGSTDNQNSAVHIWRIQTSESST